MEKEKTFLTKIITFVKVIITTLLPFLLFILLCFLIIYFLNNSKICGLDAFLLYKKFINIFFAFLLFCLIFFLFYLLFKLYKKFSHIAGQFQGSKIVSIGIVSIIYFKSIKALLFIPFFLLFEFGLNQVVSNIYDVKKAAQIENLKQFEEINTDKYLNLTLDEMNTWFSGLINSFHDYYKSFIDTSYDGKNLFLRDFILAILLLFIIGKITDLYFGQQKNESSKFLDSLFQWIKTYKTNILLTIIFIFSLFLSISSIIAIPVIRQGEETKGIAPEDFEKEVATIYQNNLKLDSGIIKYRLNYKNIDEKIKEFKTSFDTTKLNQVRRDRQLNAIYLNSFSEVLTGLNNVSSRYEIYNNQWTDLINNYPNRIENKKNEIINDYRNLSHTPSVGIERINYFSRNLKFLNDYIYNYKEDISYYQSKLKDFESSVNKYISNVFNDFKANKDLVNRTDSANTSEYLQTYRITYPFTNFPFNEIIFNPIAKKPDLISEKPMYGIFGWLSNWLIKTKSNEMAIIIGMLGFGLLGAGISSLLRNRETSIGIFKNNVSVTIVSGFSAALVIFLSVKGGMMIFATTETNLNQYATFLLCLVGSVFSEKVWIRAQDYLK